MVRANNTNEIHTVIMVSDWQTSNDLNNNVKVGSSNTADISIYATSAGAAGPTMVQVGCCDVNGWTSISS